mmetsp:Transcript_45040/g.106203  ORF Transcript_45040/g.106203 Transcript_45040/m.106203 type:complete len:214 (-) Transcript_45040:497-1138(-)
MSSCFTSNTTLFTVLAMRPTLLPRLRRTERSRWLGMPMRLARSPEAPCSTRNNPRPHANDGLRTQSATTLRRWTRTQGHGPRWRESYGPGQMVSSSKQKNKDRTRLRSRRMMRLRRERRRSPRRRTSAPMRRRSSTARLSETIKVVRGWKPCLPSSRTSRRIRLSPSGSTSRGRATPRACPAFGGFPSGATSSSPPPWTARSRFGTCTTPASA